MQGNNLEHRFESLSTRKAPEEYNFEHFTTGILLEDVLRTFRTQGICAGEIAPDFQLPQVGSGSIRLSNLRGKPVILHFGSYS